jgi:hypothetical protein
MKSLHSELVFVIHNSLERGLENRIQRLPQGGQCFLANLDRDLFCKNDALKQNRTAGSERVRRNLKQYTKGKKSALRNKGKGRQTN